jgi:hypothetical protein
MLSSPLSEAAATAASSSTGDVVRVRGIARKAHKYLERKLFMQDPTCNIAVVRTTTMRPTVGGHEMFMSRESKTLNNTLNVYRNMLVRCATLVLFAAHPPPCTTTSSSSSTRTLCIP